MLHEPTIAPDGVLRPTHLEVDLPVLAGNYASIAAATSPARVMPILKANAYGHGLVEVAVRLSAAGAPYFGVAYLEEGLRLRQAGVTTPILVLGGIVGNQIPSFLRHDLTLTASSIDKLRAVDDCASELGKTATVHLKIDTGMGRIGVHWSTAVKLLEASLSCRNVKVEGIFSHFANADDADLRHARLQLERFREVLRFYEARSLPAPIRHLSNSGGVLQLPEADFDMVRPGVLLYGAQPNPDLATVTRPIPVNPALSWRSRVVYFKVARPGEPVGYGSTWTPDAPTRLVTVPVGYGDGYLRAMSGKAHVLIGGRRCPVVGRICMDQIMVDIGWGSAWNGDPVTLIGADGGERIRIEDLAAWGGTITHEILTSINTRVPRVYITS